MIEHIALGVLTLVVIFQHILIWRIERARLDAVRDLGDLIKPEIFLAYERTLTEDGWGKAIAGEYAEVIYLSRDGTVEVVRTQDQP